VNHLLDAGWKPYILAEEIGVCSGTLAKWRDGKATPTPEQLERLRLYVRD
jgi:hypothetical protein